ncbi:MAG TPA: hypothetical protein VHV30_09690 [Polyangiaceae bacterium]|nr:hypothetical protein [Polyangiaceae bacterium]
MIDRVRDVLYRALATPAGDSLAAVRVPKDLARRLNTTLGRPLAPLAELEKRAAGRQRLAELRATQPAGAGAGAPREARPKVQAPILVYFEKDRNVRELTRIEELLGAKGFAWKRLDVTGDDATLDFVIREAGCERDDLPIVYVGSKVVGPLDAVVRADVSGELASAAFGS